MTTGDRLPVAGRVPADVIHGNALDLPLPDASVDLVVTSPPYFGLRSYTDDGAHYAGQIGDEATPAEFVDALLAATAEMVRVVKPSGSIWVNLGDKYAGTRMDGSSGNGTGASGLVGTPSIRDRSATMGRGSKRSAGGVPAKSLLGIPWRYALRCIDDLGLILRAEVIWSKPNGLPESVTDRVRRSHETWFHFTREPRYYSAVDEVREPHTATVTGRSTAGWKPGPSGNREVGRGAWDDATVRDFVTNPLGKLPGSVWTVSTQPLQVPAHLGVDHFAAFPMEWPRRIITGWSPRAVCTACGEGRRPVVHRATTGRDNSYAGGTRSTVDVAAWRAVKAADPDRITGYACGCPDTSAPAAPGVVLDPFGGTGTTALVAHALGRRGISVDLSADYCRLARWRTTDPGQLAAALQVDRPEPSPMAAEPDLLSLLEDVE